MDKLKIKINNIFFSVIIIFLLLFSPVVFAQNKNVLSITPPLIKNNVDPGQVWKSYIKVINNNDTPIDVYVSLKDFKGGDNGESVVFLEKDENNSDKLSNWIKIEEGPINIAASESKNISFIVDVPSDASPGGHYVAFLIGTKPTDSKNSAGSVVKISSQLTSLMFLNIKGDIFEKGQIREFSTAKSFYTKPDIDFKLRFENIGNVHIQPQGEIRVYDWFGKDKGNMTINHGTEFGNVLPKNIREWKFNWQGENNLFEMGRYKAKLILGYGNEARQTVDQDLYFWVINIKLLLITILPILLFLIIIILIIKSYIRRVIRKTKEELGLMEDEVEVVSSEDDYEDEEYEEDLEETEDKKNFWKIFLWLIFGVILVILIIFGVLFYLNKQNNNFVVPPTASNEEDINKGDELQNNNFDKTDNLKQSVEEEKKEIKDLEKEVVQEKKENKIDKKLEISVLNGSGVSGAAGTVAEKLKDDYLIIDISNADSYEYKYSYIRYKKGLKNEASKLRSELFSVEAELEEFEKQEEDLVIIVGMDFK